METGDPMAIAIYNGEWRCWVLGELRLLLLRTQPALAYLLFITATAHQPLYNTQSASTNTNIQLQALQAHQWSGPRPGGLALRLRDSWETEVRGCPSLAPRVGSAG
jgi:hypothetical protein